MTADDTRTYDPHAAVDYLIANAQKFAAAKAQRVFLDEFRKSKKALLMKQSPESSAVAQERDAYSHPEYLALLDGLKQAVEVEETLRWKLVAAQARIEVYRTQEASNRMQDRTMR